MQDAKRKKAGNLLVADLNDALTVEDMAKMEVLDTDYLKTVMIAIPKIMKQNFEEKVYELGSDLVGYGGETRRAADH